MREEMRGALELFAGLGRLSCALTAAGCPWVEAWDLGFSPQMDLLNPANQAYLLGRIEAGVFGFVFLNPPMLSFSVRREPRLRTKKYPRGCPWLAGSGERKALELGNNILDFVLAVMRAAASARTAFGSSHPEGSQLVRG